MTYDEIMARVNASRVNRGNIPLSKNYNYEEPYKMMITEMEETDASHLKLSVAFKNRGKFVEKTFSFVIKGNGSYYWEEFINTAFLCDNVVNWEDVFGRPFVAKIVKNDRYENIKVISGYMGDFPEVPEGLE